MKEAQIAETFSGLQDQRNWQIQGFYGTSLIPHKLLLVGAKTPWVFLHKASALSRRLNADNNPTRGDCGLNLDHCYVEKEVLSLSHRPQYNDLEDCFISPITWL
jgi:hypothetical protein